MMAKYRLLTIEELKELENEFVEYLVLFGITADEWGKIKYDEPEKADSTIRLFSDVVFEKIMRKTQYLERRRSKDIRTLQCLKDKFIVMGLNVSKIDASLAGGPNVNLNDIEYMKNAMQDSTLEPGNIHFRNSI